MKKNVLFLLIPFLALLTSCRQNQENQLVIFHAGSLSLPMKALADSFTVMYPKTQFRMEAAGSVDCARKITELGRSCDILASADYLVIDELLIPEHASVNMPFAMNSMVIAYTGRSRLSGEINQDNWPQILLSPDVFYGRADPDSDPCGYRTLLMLQLAEHHYRGNKGTLPFTVTDFEKKDTRFIRPKEVDLLALLGNYSIDYIFIYRSIAVQHDLRYLELPPQINLGDSTLSDHYATATLKIRGGSPGDSITVKGTPITYSFTIPRKAENPALAEKFAAFLIDPRGGQKILRTLGQ
ncbi:MAG: tungstate ABC transporter substrate-binding protein WtpA [Bacteroidales bacterium]|jgi:molybdate/tungstate transport system substrate-binding protein|nr:tungstate ABC transporter substrate-binding protein WtpA [Bacteroidales bacterium]MDD2264242.1 tungstate ABC transporter substrate-binding protein WtpA [Bacteroidales bacterium]MDD2831476.1 tungstate ABC transporter substrate-binding protein WtpA [Bacteroidales bacterium]MDD3208470.1 tungstate ABC transporter substrate-binding protein WtpA [Bacteroidales bacterium]MDD3697117.1 tungstate ABC transporter substrate-binding protein WtpA [Bacteroidales bacterium]